jgi:hypothetical protein
MCLVGASFFCNPPTQAMDMKLGVKKATSWRESGLLETQACSLTGSMEPHMVEYKLHFRRGQDPKHQHQRDTTPKTCRTKPVLCRGVFVCILGMICLNSQDGQREFINHMVKATEQVEEGLQAMNIKNEIASGLLGSSSAACQASTAHNAVRHHVHPT